MNLQELAALITVRDYTFRSIDNVLLPMSKDEVKALQLKLQMLDKQVLKGILELNLNTSSGTRSGTVATDHAPTK